MIRFLYRFNWIVVVFTLLAYCAPLISPHTASLFIFLGLAYPWLLFFNILFILFWLLSRKKYVGLSVITVLFGWSYLSQIIGFNFIKDSTPNNALKVMTYNMGGVTVKNNKLAQLNNFIKKQNCDIICAQEFSVNSAFKYQLENVIELARYPYNVSIDGNAVCIFSKYPIIQKGIVKFDKSNDTNGCTWADIQLKDKIIVRVYAVHLRSNSVSGIADDLAQHTDYEEKETWAKMFRMLKLVRRNAQIRANEAEKIKAHIQTCPYPVILGGDFNDIPISYTYSVLSSDLQDAFQEKGRGFGITYNGNIPALKIDHILTSSHFKLWDCSILEVPYSDHFPVVSTMQIQ